LSLQALDVQLYRHCEYRRRPIYVAATGFIDFGAKTLVVPPGSSVKASIEVDAALTNWETTDALPDKPAALVPVTVYRYSVPQKLRPSGFDHHNLADVKFAKLP